MSNLSLFRHGLKRTVADPWFGLAFQGGAADYYVLHDDGLVNRYERVELTDGTLGCALTDEGVRLARQMKS